MLYKSLLKTLLKTLFFYNIFNLAHADLPSPVSTALTPAGNIPVICGVYQSDPAHTSLFFKVNHFGLSNYTARFTDVTAILTYDPKNPTKSTVTATIKPGSIQTDYPEPNKINFDQELANKDTWFNATKFPEITFKSNTILLAEDNKTGIIMGDLTILGVTKPASMNITLNGSYTAKPITNQATMGFSAVADLKRSDWGLSNSIPDISDMVKIIIEIEFNKTGECRK